MGRIAKSLVKTFRQQSSEIAKAAQHFSAGLPGEIRSQEDLIKDGYDAQHALYIAVQNFASLFAEDASGLDAFDEFATKVTQAEDEYMPSAPPMSPITQSFFWTWALFDVRFGTDQETVGDCLITLLQSVQAPDGMLCALEKFSGSRMGIYENCGEQDGKILLRELVTGDELLCHSPTGYAGRQHELWYVRLTPPVSDDFDYHVAVTTPYVLTEASAEDWTAFLNKHLLEAGDKRRALHDLLKYGNSRLNWMEFVFQAYHHYQYDAIYLAGIPDVAASLPHSPVHDETEQETQAVAADDAVVPIKLTEAQRKAAADVCPQLSAGLRLGEKNARTVQLRQSEVRGLAKAARQALQETTGPRRVTFKKIIAITDSPRARSASAATIYQFKVTLVGSKPPIWRRIQVEDCTLADLHHYIQAAMGWMGGHLHEFDVDGERYAAPSPFFDDLDDDDDTLDASAVRISELIGGRTKFRCQYIYDFGDYWEHRIELEEICEAEAKASYPRCTAGKQACPPEDCGGILGFYQFVEAMSDRKHPEHRELKEWYGESFKPDAFDIHQATRGMRSGR